MYALFFARQSNGNNPFRTKFAERFRHSLHAAQLSNEEHFPQGMPNHTRHTLQASAGFSRFIGTNSAVRLERAEAMYYNQPCSGPRLRFHFAQNSSVLLWILKPLVNALVFSRPKGTPDSLPISSSSFKLGDVCHSSQGTITISLATPDGNMFTLTQM